jgi:aspartyl-tRNA(Asn)/glutamyl-tRNA(Gln) amidotransferase subunit A
MNLKISALEFVQQVQDGNISAEDFVAKTIEQINSVDEKLHAFLSVNENAIDQARLIDKKIKSGDKVGACFGMPISIKDNMCIKNEKTTCASKMLENFISPYDATVITKLKQQDAIFIGKTNMDEFAMGLSTEFSAFGPSRNPWNPDYVPGGSSGGSAVSVSAFECVASLGSDTGGSVRNPASFCSVVGYKPTYGLISRYGLISYANSIEQIGPITRTVKDVAFMLNIIAGIDPNDNTTIDNKNEDYLSGIDSGIEGKKIGIITDMMSDGVDPVVLSATKDAISKLEGLGATCEEISIDMVKYSVAAYYTITATEAGSNLARYDNLRYGYDFSVEGYEFNSYISKAREKFGPEVTRRMIIGGFVPSAGHAGKYFLKALKVKSKLTKH